MLAALLILGSCPAAFGELPAELRKAQESRANLFDTAHIEFSLERGGSRQFYSAQYGGGDFLLERFGDETGLVEPHFREPGMAHAYSPHRLLFTAEGAQWEYRDQDLFGTFREPEAELIREQPDVRSFGLMPYAQRYEAGWELAVASAITSRLNTKELQFSKAEMEGGLVRIEASSETHQFAWELDPTKDFNPVRTTLVMSYPDEPRREFECRTTYTQWDGRWFPETVETVDHGQGDSQTLRVLYAELDKPWHPKFLEPGVALQMPAGINLGYVAAQPQAEGKKIPYAIFDGVLALTPDQCTAREDAGDFPSRAPFSALLAARRKGNLPGATPPEFATILDKPDEETGRRAGLWEHYTRQFMIVHKLDRPQTVRAWEYLRDCQGKAKKVLEEHAAEVKDIDRRITTLAEAASENPASPDVGKPSDEVQHLNERRGRLVDKPIEKLFSECLRKQLWDLLNPTQVQAWQASRERGGKP